MVGSNLVACSSRKAGSGVSVRGVNPGRTKLLPMQGLRCWLRSLLGLGTSTGHCQFRAGRDVISGVFDGGLSKGRT